MTEKLWAKLAWLLPRGLAYWAAVRVIAHATQGKHGNTEVPRLTAIDALKRWDDR